MRAWYILRFLRLPRQEHDLEEDALIRNVFFATLLADQASEAGRLSMTF